MTAKRQPVGINPEQLADETLFKRYQEGDQACFATLMRRYQGPMYGMILKSVRNSSSADELFQDVFFKVIERRDQFREAVSFKAWLYTICRNTLIDQARKNKRRPSPHSIFMDEEKPLEININNQEVPQDHLVSGAQLDRLVEEAFTSIPEAQRETFYLKVKGGMTFEEIGEVMDCSVNTAKSRMRYALSHLRTIFRKRGYLK